KENPILFLHETPQVLYKNNLFLRMPQSSEIDNKFKRIAVKKKTNKVDLPESKKRRMIHLIDYVQMLMRKNRSENTH
ncbi:MAG: LTA synthase family protein, partial [Bacillota bacterium]